ncbi:MAG: hypothetical protein ISR91_05535 [Candidatus Delongbacteria bacterium]|nr:hypothetical protein [Candidatus Delongbacteria bacterium]
MKVIKSCSGNDYAVFSAEAEEAARRQAHALGINLYREQSRLQPAEPQEPGLVRILRDDPWDGEPLALAAQKEPER